jgi:hypothetical protein
MSIRELRTCLEKGFVFFVPVPQTNGAHAIAVSKDLASAMISTWVRANVTEVQCRVIGTDILINE